MEKLLNVFGGRFPLKELDVGAFATLRAKGMNFDVKAYEAEGLGHISVMRARGMLGLMRMDTLIVNPKMIDLPLYSYDRILAMGNDTLIVELDYCVIEMREALKQSYAYLTENRLGVGNK